MHDNDAREGTSPDQLHQQAVDLMNGFAAQKASPFVSALVEKFSMVTLPFSSPTFLPQDFNNPSHRVDDLMGGFPYTSDDYPWPKTKGSDMPMQALLQINLANAGNILSANLGTETLQVWGPVAANANALSTDLDAFCVRLIPADQIVKPPSGAYIDWKVVKNGKPTAAFYMTADAENPVANNTRVRWSAPLPMFGSRQHFLEIAWRDLREASDDFGDDELMDLADEFFDAMDASPLSAGSNADYLGGFGGQTGGEYDPSYGDNLLVRITDGNGFYFATKWITSSKQGLIFNPYFTIRA